MDSFTLRSLVQELEEKLTHSSLDKVQQVGPMQFVFRFRRDDLFISADDQHPALYVTHTSQRKASGSSSQFLLHVRKHLVVSRLEKIEQLNHDRIVQFHFVAIDDFGQAQHPSLIVELINRRSNLYLLDSEGNIIERLIIREKERQSVGTRYIQPDSPGQFDPLSLTEPEFDRIVFNAPSLRDILVQTVKGFSPLLAREVEWRANQETAYNAFQSVLLDLTAHPHPCVYAPTSLDEIRPGEIHWEKAVLLSPIYLRWPSEVAGLMATKFATISEATEKYEEVVEGIRSFQSQKRAVVSALRQKIKKHSSRLGQAKEDMRRLGDYERERHYGELLLSNLQQTQRGEKGFWVTDYYDPEQPRIEIPAEPQRTVQQTAQSYFERYRKYKRKSEALGQQITEGEENGKKLMRLAEQVEAASTTESLATWAHDVLGHPLVVTHMTPEKSVKKIPGVYQFQSTENQQILVGRSAEANQRLTFQLARSHDIWLHAADYPGSHVILRQPKGVQVPFRSLVEAAELAAFYSQARQSGKVVVHYTERKFVHKIPGAAPGLVRLADFKSITVEPRIQAIRTDI